MAPAMPRPSLVHPPARLRSALAAGLVASAPGCSWIWVNRAPELPVMPGPLECTESTTLPALDVAGSAVSGVVGILAVAAALAIPVVSGCPTADSSCQTPGDQGAALAVGASLVALGTATAFSAAYGYRQTSRCREIAGWQAGCLSGLEDDCWKIYGPRARSELPPPPPIPIGPVPPPEPKPAPPPPKSPFGPPSRPPGG